MTKNLEILIKAIDKASPNIKKVRDNFSTTGRIVQKAQQAMAQTQGQLGQIKAFQAMGQEAGKNRKQFQAAIDKVKQLENQQQKAGKSTQAMAKRMQAAKAKVKQLSSLQSEYTRRLTKQQNALKITGIDVGRLAEAEKSVIPPLC